MLNSRLLYASLLLIAEVFGGSQSMTGQSAAIAGRPASMRDLAFMSGRWEGEMEGAHMDEEWSAPVGDSMMGMFRTVKNNEPTFYEFMVVERTEGAPILKLKHFNAGLMGWEEKDKAFEFPLVNLEKNRAVFERTDKDTRLSYERTSPTSLRVILEQTANGKKTTEEFRFTRLR